MALLWNNSKEILGGVFERRAWLCSKSNAYTRGILRQRGSSDVGEEKPSVERRRGTSVRRHLRAIEASTNSTKVQRPISPAMVVKGRSIGPARILSTGLGGKDRETS
ncbi:hypothetical protein KM043_008584 [Ampulex compressa]|nr:hypothetical protein KM043_008584 [Ampulex compressa]